MPVGRTDPELWWSAVIAPCGGPPLRPTPGSAVSVCPARCTVSSHRRAGRPVRRQCCGRPRAVDQLRVPKPAGKGAVPAGNPLSLDGRALLAWLAQRALSYRQPAGSATQGLDRSRLTGLFAAEPVTPPHAALRHPVTTGISRWSRRWVWTLRCCAAAAARRGDGRNLFASAADQLGWSAASRSRPAPPTLCGRTRFRADEPDQAQLTIGSGAQIVRPTALPLSGRRRNQSPICIGGHRKGWYAMAAVLNVESR